MIITLGWKIKRKFYQQASEDTILVGVVIPDFNQSYQDIPKMQNQKHLLNNPLSCKLLLLNPTGGNDLRFHIILIQS